MTEKKSEELWKLPLYKIYTDDDDVNLITKIIKRGSEWAIGPEIEEFENLGAHAFLIGESLMIAENIGDKLREFIGDRKISTTN